MPAHTPPTPMPWPQRLRAAGLNAGLLAAVWWAWAVQSGALALLVPACLLALALQAVAPTLPRWAARLAVPPLVLWLVWVTLAAGRLLRDASEVPLGVWVVGGLLLPVLASLGSGWAAIALWLCCLAVLLALLVGWLLPLSSVLVVLFVLAWVLAALAGLARLVFSQLPPPTPTPVPVFDLNAHLDSPDAQEGADKYTRE